MGELDQHLIRELTPEEDSIEQLAATWTERANRRAERQQSELQAPSQASDPRVEALSSRITERARKRSEAQQRALEVAVTYGNTLDPERERRVLMIQAREGLPGAVVRRNLEKLEGISPEQRQHIGRMIRESPRLSKWLQDPNNLGVSVDDTAHLTGLSWLLRAPIAAWKEGRLTEELAQRGFQSMSPDVWKVLGVDPDDNEARMREIEQNLIPRYYGEEGTFQRGWVEFWKMAPMRVGAAKASLGTGAAVAGAALAAGQTPPLLLAPEEVATVPVGFTGGAIAGAYAYSAVMETGLLYRDLGRMKDRLGNPIDPDVRVLASSLGGAVSGGLELVGLRSFTKAVPGVDQAVAKITRDAISKALTRKSFREALLSRGKAYAETMVVEPVTEMLQEATSIVAGELAQGISEGTLTPVNFEQELARITDVGLATWEAMAVGGFAMAPGGIAIDTPGVMRARNDATRLGMLADTARGSKLRERAPAKFREAVRVMMEEGRGVKRVFVPIQKWNEIWTQRGIDPGEAAGRVLGDGGERYRKAQQLGVDADLTIPIDVFLEKLVETEVFEDLRPNIRLNQAAPTLNEAMKDHAEIPAWVIEGEQRERSTYNPAEQSTYNRLYTMAIDASRDPGEADAWARQTTHALSNLARRSGRSLTDLAGRLNSIRRTVSPGAIPSEDVVEDLVRDAVDEAERRMFAGERPDAYAPISPNDDYKGLAVWIARNGGISFDEEQVYRENYPRIPGLANRNGLTFDAWAERLAETWPEAFEGDGPQEKRETARRWLQDDWALGTPELPGNRRRDRFREKMVETAMGDVLKLVSRATDLGAAPDAEALVAIATGTGQWDEIQASTLKVGDVVLLADTMEFHRVVDEDGQKTLEGASSFLFDEGVTYDGLVMDPRRRRKAAQGLRLNQQKYERFVGGLSIERPGRVPTDRQMAAVSREIEEAAGGDGVTVHALSTLGRFGEDERSFDLDVRAPVGYDPIRLLRKMVEIARDHDQESLELSRQLNPTEVHENMRPGVEIRLPRQTLEQAAPILEALHDRGVRYYTFQVSQERTRAAVSGAMPDVVGLRILYVPEYDTVSELLGLSDDELSSRMDREGLRLRDLAAAATQVDGVDKIVVRHFDTQVLFREEYDAYLEQEEAQGPDAGGVPEGDVRDRAEGAWPRASVREGLEAAARRAPVGREGQGGDRSVLRSGDDGLDSTKRLKATDDEGNVRGYIEFDPSGRRFDITLFELADASTLFHETAHFYLELLGDLAETQDAPADVLSDYQKVLSWLGAENRAGITEEMQEKWARGFEQYLREGKTPSLDLQFVFAKVKAWMLAIYRKAAPLVKINQEIRGVFDRIIASEEEIDAARDFENLEPIPELREQMTAEEYEAYLETARRADEAGKDEMRPVLLAEEQREWEDWWQQERDETYKVVEAEFAQFPLFKALAYLQQGRIHGMTSLPESMRDEAGRPLKLSRQLLLKRYDKATLADLEGFHRREGGVDPDDLAPLLGYANGEALVRALRTAPDYEGAIDKETRKRLDRKFGNIMETRSELAAEALEAANNWGRVEQLMIEVRTLRRSLRPGAQQQNRPAFTLDDLRENARQIVENETVAELKPGVFAVRARKHARLAFEAARRGNLAKAYDEKVMQAWNTVAFRTVRDAREDVEIRLRFARRLQKAAAQSRLGRAGEDYRATVNQILEQYILRRESRRATTKRIGLREWVASKQERHEDVVIPETVLDEQRRTHFSELTYSELRDVTDALKSVDHQAMLKTTLLKNDNRRSFDRARRQAIAALEQHVPITRKHEPQPGLRDRKYRIQEFLLDFDAKLLRIEEVVDRMDGRDANGIWSQLLWQPVVEAQAREADLQRDYTLKLAEVFQRLPKERREQLLTERVKIAALGGQEVTRETLVVAALNTGSESNFQRLAEGGIGFEKWDDTVLMEMLDELTEEDWNFVQGIWDTIEGMWPMIEALEKRLTGLAPPKVEARSFERFGTLYRGGYYPLVYNRETHPVGERQANAADSTYVLFDHHLARAITVHGFTKARVEAFAAPLSLDLGVLVQHLHQVMHDVTHREALISIHRLLRDPDVFAAMNRHLGPAQTRAFEVWLRRIANPGGDVTDKTLDRFLRGARLNATVAAMGYKATVSLQNFANYANVLEKVQVKHFSKALRDMYSKDWNRYREDIERKSGEMRHRFQNMERDVRQLLEEEIRDWGKAMPGARRLRRKVQRLGFEVIARTDAAVAYPAWLAAYRQSLANGRSQQEAVLDADRIIRTTLSAGAPKDIANIQGGPEVQKALTVFYGWFSTAYMRFRSLGYDIKNRDERGFASPAALRDLASWLARILSFWVVPAILAELLAGRGPDDDDDEGFADWAAVQVGLYPFLTIPLVRDVAGYMSSDSGFRSVRFGLLPGVLEEVARAAETLAELPGEITNDEADTAQYLDRLASFSGYVFGLPSGQGRITFRYLHDVMGGTANPEDVVDFAQGVLYRRSQKELQE